LAQKLQRKTSAGPSKSIIAELFSGSLVSSSKNLENPEEPPSHSTDDFRKLVCHISLTTNFVLEGLKEALEEPFSKQSPTLGREAKYLKTSQISRLPYYLTIQFMRFFWRQDKSTKAKIVRPVEFPFVIDLYSLCAPELQKELVPTRKLLEVEEEEQLQKERELKKAKSDDEGKGKGPAQESPKIAPIVRSGPFATENHTGKYELAAVLTHKGRDADSGHYVAWVKQPDGKWILFDDDKVREVDADEIKKLSGKGGGDWHMAYVCLYRSLNPTKPADSPSSSSSSSSSTTQSS